MTRTHDIRTGKVPKRKIVAVLALTAMLALGLPSVAGADTTGVSVTAQVSGPAFSLTILTDGLVDFGSVPKGTISTSALEPIIRVESSLPWDFTDASDATILLGATTVPRDQVMRHSPSLAFGTGIASGVYTISSTYTLDLTSAEVLALPSGTQIATNFRYTAVQQ